MTRWKVCLLVLAVIVMVGSAAAQPHLEGIGERASTNAQVQLDARAVPFDLYWGLR